MQGWNEARRDAPYDATRGAGDGTNEAPSSGWRDETEELGDETVDLRALVVEHRMDLFRYARSFTRNDADAEDLAQTAVMRALAARVVLDDPRKAKWYLLRIVRNLATDQARSRARVRVEPWAEVPETVAGDPEPEAALLRDADRAVPRKALSALNPAHREILELRFVEELDYETVADRLHTTEHAARQRVYRAMQAMRGLVHRTDVGFADPA